MVACSVANHKNQNTNQNRKHKARRRSPSQICVSPSKGQQSKQRTGQEPNRNNHKRFAKDTVVKTHCVTTDSKPATNELVATQKSETRSTLLPRGQQKVAIPIHCRLTQPLRVLSRVLVHVPMFRKKEQVPKGVSKSRRKMTLAARCLVPLPIAGSGPVATTKRSHRAR